jgi:hypothetical protein
MQMDLTCISHHASISVFFSPFASLLFPDPWKIKYTYTIWHLQRKETDPPMLETSSSRAVTGYMQSRTDAQRSLFVLVALSLSLSSLFLVCLSSAKP